MIEISIAQSFILDPKGQNISIRVNPPPLKFLFKTMDKPKNISCILLSFLYSYLIF